MACVGVLGGLEAVAGGRVQAAKQQINKQADVATQVGQKEKKKHAESTGSPRKRGKLNVFLACNCSSLGRLAITTLLRIN